MWDWHSEERTKSGYSDDALRAFRKRRWWGNVCSWELWVPAISQLSRSDAKGTKYDILKCLESDFSDSISDAVPSTDVVILDGAFIVHSLRPGETSTFQEYAEQVFVPYVIACLDILSDVYKQNSLKSSTREVRGSGMRCRVSSITKIPSNWQGFPRVDENKT